MKIIFKKKFSVATLVFCATLASASSKANPHLDYACSLGDEHFKDSVFLNDKEIIGKPSCMIFKSNKSLCWRFERQVKIKKVFLLLREKNQLQTTMIRDYFALLNSPLAEGATTSYEIRSGANPKERLNCVFANVNWIEANNLPKIKSSQNQ